MNHSCCKLRCEDEKLAVEEFKETLLSESNGWLNNTMQVLIRCKVRTKFFNGAVGKMVNFGWQIAKEEEKSFVTR